MGFSCNRFVIIHGINTLLFIIIIIIIIIDFPCKNLAFQVWLHTESILMSEPKLLSNGGKETSMKERLSLRPSAGIQLWIYNRKGLLLLLPLA
jgi:hypothetical protein